MENIVLNQDDFICLSDMSDEDLEAWFNAPIVPERVEQFVVVHHPCYRSDFDLGYRMYESDDLYLQEHPSMYSVVEYFPTMEAANAFIRSEQDKFYSDGYDDTDGWYTDHKGNVFEDFEQSIGE